ncbi:hypothetical protein [Asaia sp. HN010]|uniref:hypothetical protein n=1 Tax=Asaia sp. HN010 TaxID=3081233 RepID=UPI0030187299
MTVTDGKGRLALCVDGEEIEFKEMDRVRPAVCMSGGRDDRSAGDNRKVEEGEQAETLRCEFAS